MKPASASLEPNTHNRSATTVVLYFQEKPTREQVVTALGETKLALSVDCSDPFFNYEEHPTALSQQAKLFRYECYPTG